MTARPPTRADRPAHPATAEDDLQVANARWQAVFGTVRDAIIAIDAESRIALFNPAAEAMFGYARSEILGRDVSVLMPSPYREEHARYVRHYETTGEARAIGRIRMVRGLRKDGSVFPVELSVSETHVGERRLYTAILRDTSERLAGEESLRQQRDFADRLIETAPLIALVVDRSGGIVRFNAYLERLAGRRLEDARGRDWIDTFIAAHDRAMMRAASGEGRSAEEVQAYLADIRAADGEPRLIAWTSKALTDAAGDPDAWLYIGEDITDRVRAERELQELQRAAQERARLADVGAITAKIVHDLGNPLAALSMQAQLILRRARRGDFQPVAPVQGPAEQILRTLRRLEGLVREFNEFARDQRLDLRRLEVLPLLRSCAELWQALAAERGIRLRVADCRSLPSLRADEVMLRRVLDNLIKNAIEAEPASGGEVVIAAAVPAAGRICITVDDTGSGIAPGIDVFKLFETTKRDGTGIGLAVAKQMVTAHGGTIGHVAREGGGTRFLIELPIKGPTKQSNDGLAPG